MPTLVETLTDAFSIMNFGMLDWPVRDLALKYAREIDAGDKRTLRSLGPELLRVLVELQMTPKARQTIKNSMKEAMSDDDASFANRRANARSRYSTTD